MSLPESQRLKPLQGLKRITLDTRPHSCVSDRFRHRAVVRAAGPNRSGSEPCCVELWPIGCQASNERTIDRIHIHFPARQAHLRASWGKAQRQSCFANDQRQNRRSKRKRIDKGIGRIYDHLLSRWSKVSLGADPSTCSTHSHQPPELRLSPSHVPHTKRSQKSTRHLTSTRLALRVVVRRCEAWLQFVLFRA